MMEQDVTADLENGETTNINYPWPYLSKFNQYLLQFCTFDKQSEIFECVINQHSLKL